MKTGEVVENPKEYIPVTINGHPQFHGKSGVAVGQSVLGKNYSAVRLNGQPFVFGIENGYLQSEKPLPWAASQDKQQEEGSYEANYEMEER